MGSNYGVYVWNRRHTFGLSNHVFLLYLQKMIDNGLQMATMSSFPSSNDARRSAPLGEYQAKTLTKTKEKARGKTSTMIEGKARAKTLTKIKVEARERAKEATTRTGRERTARAILAGVTTCF